MTNPLISVVVPCYNQARFLAEALESIRAQTLEDWECIIVNDGSTDDTAAVAARFVSADARFRYLFQTNRGLSGARNTGIRSASGRYIQLLDSDDTLEPLKFEVQVRQLASTSRLAVSYCHYAFGASDDIRKPGGRRFPMPNLSEEKPLHDLVSRWETSLSIPAHCFLFDARIFTEQSVSFDESLPTHEDWDCWVAVFALEPAVFATTEVLAHYRLNDASMSTNQWLMWLGFSLAVKKQLAIHGCEPELVALLTQRQLEINSRYGYGESALRNAAVRLLRTQGVQQWVPWRLQSFFRRCLSVPD